MSTTDNFFAEYEQQEKLLKDANAENKVNVFTALSALNITRVNVTFDGELVLDVMPLDASILGLSNRWYAHALHTAVTVELPSGLQLKAITAPYFLGTKIEAFRGRGHDDYFGSHDLEDFITVIDGRPSLLQEVGKHHLIFVRSLQRPCAGFSLRHDSSMRCRVTFPPMRQAKRASFFFRQSSKR